MYDTSNGKMVMGTLPGWLSLGWKWLLSVAGALVIGYLLGVANATDCDHAPVATTEYTSD